MPLLQLPDPSDIHDEWDPTYQAVAKCDHCHQRNSGVLQTCRKCRMSFCRDCAKQNQQALTGNLLGLAEQSKVLDLDEKQYMWLDFALDSKHLMHINALSWTPPSRKGKVKVTPDKYTGRRLRSATRARKASIVTMSANKESKPIAREISESPYSRTTSSNSAFLVAVECPRLEDQRHETNPMQDEAAAGATPQHEILPPHVVHETSGPFDAATKGRQRAIATLASDMQGNHLDNDDAATQFPHPQSHVSADHDLLDQRCDQVPAYHLHRQSRAGGERSSWSEHDTSSAIPLAQAAYSNERDPSDYSYQEQSRQSSHPIPIEPLVNVVNHPSCHGFDNASRNSYYPQPYLTPASTPSRGPFAALPSSARRSYHDLYPSGGYQPFAHHSQTNTLPAIAPHHNTAHPPLSSGSEASFPRSPRVTGYRSYQSHPLPNAAPSASRYDINILANVITNTVRHAHSTDPRIPLDRHLQLQVEYAWHQGFGRDISADLGPSHSFVVLVSVVYAAMSHLGIPMRNVARDWIVEQERMLLCEQGEFAYQHPGTDQ